MDGIIYLTLEQAEQIHRKTITYSGGGTYEPLDVGKLDSVLQHIQNDLYYPTFVDKLTHLFFCTCEFHCFADGTKDLPSRYHYNFYYLTVIWESLKIL